MNTIPDDLTALIKKYLPSNQLVLLFKDEDVQHNKSMIEACQKLDWNSILYCLDYHRYKHLYLKAWYDESLKFEDVKLRNFFEYVHYSKSKYSSYFDKRFINKECGCNKLDIDHNVDCDCVHACNDNCSCSCHACICNCHNHPEPDRLKELGIRSSMTAYDAFVVFDSDGLEDNITIFSKLSEYMFQLYKSWNYCDVANRYLKLYDIILDHYISKYKLHNFDKRAYKNSKLDQETNLPKPLCKKMLLRSINNRTIFENNYIVVIFNNDKLFINQMDTLPNDLSALIKKYLSSDQVILLFENEDVQYCNMYDACHNRNWNSILYNLDQNRYNDSYMKVWCDESIKFNDGELRKFFEYIYYSNSKYSSYFDKRFFVKGCECNELDENIDCDCVCNCKVDCNCSCHKCECDDCHVHPHPIN